MKFEELELKSEIAKSLAELNIADCTEIQDKSIPLVLDGKDISGLSQTGSGKTFAFLVPLIERILRTQQKPAENPTELDQKRAFDSWNSGHFILVLAPTRELADQIHKNVVLITKNTSLRTALIYGGVDYETQTKALAQGAEIVVGTPGRLIDLYKSHHINFKHVKALVFDEADRMFDMGFKDDMIYILQRAPKERQICLFSATLNFDVLNTIYRFDANPVEINISRDQVKAGEVTDEILHVGESDKPQYLLSLIMREKPKQTIIFSNYKNNVDRLGQFLTSNGVPTVGISSLLTQSQRERVLEQFKNENERNTLVATDVAARGLDIKGVDLVINYDLPDDAENYVHRIGRTGRAGAKGKAFSLVSDRDVAALSRIESYLKNKIPMGWLDDESLIKDLKPMTRDNFRGESRVKKTGLAAVKASIPSQGGGRPDNRGGRNRHDRNDRNDRNDRPRNADSRHQGDRPPRGDRHADSREPRRDSQSANNGNIHRDRKLGRHQQPHSQNTGASANGASAPARTHAPARGNNPNYKNKSFKKTTQPQQKNEKRQSYRNTKPKAKISQKIKGFFKSLFK